MADKSENMYFKICRFFTLDVFEITAVKFIVVANTFFLTFLCVFQTVVFVQKASLSYFIQYGPTYFMSLYILLSHLSLPNSLPIVRTSTEFMRSWKFTELNKALANKHTEKWMPISLYFAVALCLGLISSISYMVPTDEDEKILFEIRIFEDYFPKYQSYAIFLYRMDIIPVAFCSVVQPTFQNIYFWYYQHYHLAQCIHRLETLSGSDKLNIHEQNQIAEELKSCLKYHIQICQTFQEYLKNSQTFIYLFQAVGTLLIGNLVIYYFSFREFLRDQFPRIFSLGATSFLLLAGLAHNGQEMEDVSSHLFDVLRNMDWYNWNERNKKMYLMFLINSQKPFKFKFSENISVNYRMSVEIMKTFVSTISVMRNLTNK